MKPIEEVIMDMLVSSGLSREDESAQQLAGSLEGLFLNELSKVEITASIREVERALEQKNKMLYGQKIQRDIADRDLIDPKILEMRLQGLRKILK